MKPLRFLFDFFLVIFFSSCVSAKLAHNINFPRLNPLSDLFSLDLEEVVPSSSSSNSLSASDFVTYFYNQTLDHFNYGPESYATFKQKYFISTKYWGGANRSSPIFAYLGAEAPLNNLTSTGFLNENAPRFHALAVYIEHRFYGESSPLGSMAEAMKNETIRGYFNSAQAIADYAEVLLYVKQRFSSPFSPIVVVGGSYGGMLAAWFRLKYPHVAIGALASSAPVLYFDDITPQNGYYSIVTKDFQEASESCYETIKESWSEIDRVSSTPSGLSILSQRFNTCTPLEESRELKLFLRLIYARAAQYNRPPNYPVNIICGAIDGAPNGTDIMGRIFAGVVAAFKGNSNMSNCYHVDYFTRPSETSEGWRWQVCSEMVIGIGIDGNDSMFEANPFDLKEFMDWCKFTYGVPSRPHWVTTYYGGHDIKLVLQKFGSNIIFSNGLRDPYSSGGVLEDLSDSLLAVHTDNGSHCLDILPATQSDPLWLVKQRNIEVDIIDGWIRNYYADLVAKNREELNH